MRDYCKAIKDAIELVVRARSEVLGDPLQVWRFLTHVEAHLQEQLTAEFEPVWAELRHEPKP